MIVDQSANENHFNNLFSSKLKTWFSLIPLLSRWSSREIRQSKYSDICPCFPIIIVNDRCSTYSSDNILHPTIINSIRFKKFHLLLKVRRNNLIGHYNSCLNVYLCTSTHTHTYNESERTLFFSSLALFPFIFNRILLVESFSSQNAEILLWLLRYVFNTWFAIRTKDSLSREKT